jgi:protein-S-isoprenylcysteine O-methyltransferase Ste14
MNTRALELKIPPVVVTLAVAACMWLTERLVPELTHQIPGGGWLAVVGFAAGVSVIVLGLREFSKAKTTVNPHHPDTSTFVVTSGIYRFTRNPMYLGMMLALLAWALVLSNLAAASFLPLFVVFIERFQIRPEEAALSIKFGSQYSSYLRSVRRWL